MSRIIQQYIKLSLALVFLFSSTSTIASSRDRSLYRPINSVKLQSQSPHGDFIIQYLQALIQQENHKNLTGVERSFYEWAPDGSLISAIPPECLPEVFEKAALKSMMQTSTFGKLTQEYFNRCGNLLSANATEGIFGLIDYATASYPFLENSKIKAHIFQTKDGHILKGFIGIKDKTPRPWVIYKCGVYCGAEPNAVSLKNYMIHLFDQTPFNVIFLGNRTGEDYIINNRAFNFGGYFESQDFFDIAHWLREDSQYKDLVSSVHVVAVSLAGSAAYLTENKMSHEEKSNEKLIQSVTSLCAVSDLRPTVENMFAETLKGKIFTYITWQKLQIAKNTLTSGADLIGDEQPESSEFPKLLGQLASRFMNSNGTHIEKEREFWEKSHYSSQKSLSQVPLLVWASEDDSIVDFRINTGQLLKHNFKNPDPNLGIVKVPRGEHCGFATAYGYSPTASIIRTFILNNSPEFKYKTKSLPVQNYFKLQRMSEGERIISTWWSNSTKKNDSENLNLKIEIYGADDSLCPKEWAYEDHPNCKRLVEINFPISFFESDDFIKPQNTIEKEALIRDLNARTSLTYNETTIIDSIHWPDQISIRY
jgi:hypothetical protein